MNFSGEEVNPVVGGGGKNSDIFFDGVECQLKTLH